MGGGHRGLGAHSSRAGAVGVRCDWGGRVGRGREGGASPLPGHPRSLTPDLDPASVSPFLRRAPPSPALPFRVSVHPGAPAAPAPRPPEEQGLRSGGRWLRDPETPFTSVFLAADWVYPGLACDGRRRSPPARGAWGGGGPEGPARSAGPAAGTPPAAWLLGVRRPERAALTSPAWALAGVAWPQGRIEKA